MRRPGAILVAVLAAVLATASAAGAERDLAADAKALAKAHLERFGPGYVARIDADRHLVYVSAADASALDRVVGILGPYADAQRGRLFPHPLAWNVTVVLPTLSDFRQSGPPPDVAGYYNPVARVLMSVSFSDVLVHEFTHALHHSDQARAGQDHAVWVAEGLATLFQASQVTEGRIEVRPVPGIEGLQDAIRQKKVRPLADLCRMDRRAFRRDAKTVYPQAQCVMLYLERLGKLDAFYATYKTRYGDDPTGIKALEATLGKPLAEAEADWHRWVLDQKPPWRPARPSEAHLGVRMARAPEGVQVTGLLRGSSAERAGVLKVDDIIVSVSGHATPTAADLAEAVRGCGPGRVIDIEIIRGQRTMVVKQLLGAVRSLGD